MDVLVVTCVLTYFEYWRWRACIKGVHSQKTFGGLRKDKACELIFLVGDSDFSSLQCFDPVDWPVKTYPIYRRNCLRNNKREKIKGAAI